MNLIFVGKIVNTFGIKGELKVVSRFERAFDVFKKGSKLIINNKDYIISNCRFHKNNYLVELNDIRDINKIEYLIGYDIYFYKDELNLSDNDFLISELIDYEVYSLNNLVGKITDYDDNKVNPLVKVNHEFYIPIKGFFEKIDKKNRIIYFSDVSGLIK